MFSANLKNAAWQCIHFTKVGDAREAIGKLRSGDMAVFEVDATDVLVDQELFGALSRSLQFPDYFGMNWDALEDCLSDLSWIDAAGYVLLITGADHLWRHNPQLAGKFVSSCLAVAEDWAKAGKPFHLVFAWSGAI